MNEDQQEKRMKQALQDIEAQKKKLISYCRRYGLHENLGDKEERMLRNKYSSKDYNADIPIIKAIIEFRNWASHLSLSDL